MTSLRDSFRIYDFDSYRGTLLVTFYDGVSADDVTTLLTSGRTVRHQVLNNDEMVLLLDRCHRLQGMRQLHVEGEATWFQQQILVCLMFREDRVAIS